MIKHELHIADFIITAGYILKIDNILAAVTHLRITTCTVRRQRRQ